MSGRSAESRERISGPYQSALAYPTEERRAFLQAACGDDEALRLEVESLLAYEEGWQVLDPISFRKFGFRSDTPPPEATVGSGGTTILLGEGRATARSHIDALR
jgi:hypothetical protein